MARDEVKLSPLILGCVFKTSKWKNTIPYKMERIKQMRMRLIIIIRMIHRIGGDSTEEENQTVFNNRLRLAKHIRGRQSVVWGATASSIFPLFDKIRFSNLWSQSSFFPIVLQH
jgi:hypothetical protein